MTYAQLQSLGIVIDRGQFDRGFEPEPSSIAAFRGEQINWQKSSKVRPPPGEDLSHLNGPGKRLTMFRALLEKRGATIQAIADSTGYHIDTVRAIIYDHKRGSARARSAVYALLTQEEIAFIESFRRIGIP